MTINNPPMDETIGEFDENPFDDESKKIDETKLVSDEAYVKVNDAGEIEVDPMHSDIGVYVAKAVEDASKTTISFHAEEYIKALKDELDRLKSERTQYDPTAFRFVLY
jgi:hypothetical protein